jgi:hypothetical protein
VCHFGRHAVIVAIEHTARDAGTERAARLGQLKAEAEQHEISGNHGKAAAAHHERGEMHEAAGNLGAAVDAYKRSLDALAKHALLYGAAKDCTWMKGGR